MAPRYPDPAVLRSKVFGCEGDVSSWGGLAEPWRALVGRDPLATPFQTPDWQLSWYRWFGRRRCPVVWTLWDGADLVGLMPFIRCSGGWRTLRPMGCGPSDYLHPLAEPQRASSVYAELAEFVRSVRDIDLVDWHQLRASHPFAQAWLGGEDPVEDTGPTSFRQAECLVLDLPETFDAYRKRLSKSLRYDVGRLDRHPDRLVVRVARGDEIGRALDVFFETHARRWHRRGLPGAFVGRRMRRFHREWAVAADRNDHMRLNILEIDGEAVGAVYAMRVGATTFFYQSGFDPRHRSVSPGSLLVAAAIRRAIEDGCTAFDFLRGDEAYKRRWGPQHMIPNLRILAPTSGTLGRLGKSVNEFGHAIERRIRSRLEGHSLWRTPSRARSDDRSRR